MAHGPSIAAMAASIHVKGTMNSHTQSTRLEKLQNYKHPTKIQEKTSQLCPIRKTKNIRSTHHNTAKRPCQQVLGNIAQSTQYNLPSKNGRIPRVRHRHAHRRQHPAAPRLRLPRANPRHRALTRPPILPHNDPCPRPHPLLTRGRVRAVATSTLRLHGADVHPGRSSQDLLPRPG
jgi:hypothetical protein